jgi:hypothetical protein
MEENKQNAETMKEALENFNKHPERIENFILYLERHFSIWCKEYANTPEGIANEFLHFSEIE